MPELPEVETIRRGLEPLLAGRVIAHAEIHQAVLRFPITEDIAGKLEGRTILRLSRRAKYLLLHLSGSGCLVIHLGMTGRLAFEEAERTHATPQGRDPRHDHAVITFADGSRLVYNDVRRFGFILLLKGKDLSSHPLFAELGPEPLSGEFTPLWLAENAKGRKTSLKAFLMNQRIAAGLGNIYVSEALHRAGLLPSRSASCLAPVDGKPPAAAEALAAAIRSVLLDAIAAGGSTLRDYRQANGDSGYFQHSFQVYGREGKACTKAGCRGIVRRSVEGGRATYFCDTCQR